MVFKKKHNNRQKQNQNNKNETKMRSPVFTSTSNEKPQLLTISFEDDPQGSLGAQLINCDKVSIMYAMIFVALFNAKRNNNNFFFFNFVGS